MKLIVKALALGAALFMVGCATTDPQSELAACEARGGELLEGEFGLLNVRHSRCVMPGDKERSEEYKLACISSGRNVTTDRLGFFESCYTPQQFQPYVYKTSSVPDIEVQSIEPYQPPAKSSWNCTSTTRNGRTNTYCN